MGLARPQNDKDVFQPHTQASGKCIPLVKALNRLLQPGETASRHTVQTDGKLVGSNPTCTTRQLIVQL